VKKDCIDKTPEDYPIVDKDGIARYGVGCWRVLVGMGWHPECSEETCPKIHSSPTTARKEE